MTNALSLNDCNVDPAAVDMIYKRAIPHSVVQAADQHRQVRHACEGADRGARNFVDKDDPRTACTTFYANF